MKFFTRLISILSLILISSCTTTSPGNTAQDKVSTYEAKARNFEALARSQTISPPYSPSFRGNNSHYSHGLRMTYLMEAKRYRKLAKEQKEEDERNKAEQ